MDEGTEGPVFPGCHLSFQVVGSRMGIEPMARHKKEIHNGENRRMKPKAKRGYFP